MTIEALFVIVLEVFKQRKTTRVGAGYSEGEAADEDDLPIAEEELGEIPDENLQYVDELWGADTWQQTILTPVAEQLKSSNVSDKMQVLKCIERLL